MIASILTRRYQELETIDARLQLPQNPGPASPGFCRRHSRLRPGPRGPRRAHRSLLGGTRRRCPSPTSSVSSAKTSTATCSTTSPSSTSSRRPSGSSTPTTSSTPSASARSPTSRPRKPSPRRSAVDSGYSITASARSKKPAGKVSPSARAVLELMTNETESAAPREGHPGLAPRKILST